MVCRDTSKGIIPMPNLWLPKTANDDAALIAAFLKTAKRVRVVSRRSGRTVGYRYVQA